MWGLLAEVLHSYMKQTTSNKENQPIIFLPKSFNVADAGGFFVGSCLPAAINRVKYNNSSYVINDLGHRYLARIMACTMQTRPLLTSHSREQITRAGNSPHFHA